MFNAIESLWFFKGLPKAPPILDVARIAADSGVENILQGIFSQEKIADNPHASSFFSGPQLSELCNGVNFLFELPHVA